MENGPQSFRPGAFEGLARNVAELEEHLLLGSQEDDTKNRLTDAILCDVGEETIDHKTRLLAVGYSENADGFVVPDPIAVDTEQARLRGLLIKQFRDSERVFLHYDVYDPSDNECVDQYLIPPLSVLESAVDTSRLHPLFEVREQIRFMAERMFREQDFFQQPAEHQTELLRKHVSSEFIGYAAADYHEEVLLKIACDWYYRLPSSVEMSEDWSQYVCSGETLEGYMTNATYPECLLSSPKQITQRRDFTDSDGLPYIVLENKAFDGLTLVPLSAVTSFSSDIDHYV